MPEPPNDGEFPIYVNTLNQGFDIGVDSSEKQRNWLTDMGGFMRMSYPSGQKDGSVFIIVGAVAFENTAENFSHFATLAVDLKGEKGGECVAIGIEDVQRSPTTPQLATALNREWETRYFSLSGFGDVNLDSLHTVTKFSFFGDCPQTVYFRNVRYLNSTIDEEKRKPFYVFTCNFLATGYELGVAIDSTATNQDSISIENQCGTLKINYPSGKEWGSIFFYQKHNIPQDFSSYSKLAMELKGEKGGEVVHVGIKDVFNVQSNVKITLVNTQWDTLNIPLNSYPFIDLKQIIVAASFTFFGENAQTIYLRNIRYLP